MRSLNSFLNVSIRLGRAVVVPSVACLCFYLPAVALGADSLPAQATDPAVAPSTQAAGLNRQVIGPVASDALSPAAKQRIAEEHARHLAVEKQLSKLEVDLKTIADSSIRSQKTLAAAREAALKSAALSALVDALTETRVELYALLRSNPDIAPLIERQDALEAEIRVLANSRRDLMLKMQREGIREGVRDEIAAASRRASQAQAELVQLNIEIERKQDVLCESDEAAKTLKSAVQEKEGLMETALAKVPEVAALEEERRVLKTRTREVTSERVELRKQIKTECACRRPRP